MKRSSAALALLGCMSMSLGWRLWVLLRGRLRATVRVLEAVHVLGDVGTFIMHVIDPVVVIVRLGTTVRVLKAVQVLGRIRAFVVPIGDPIPITIPGSRRP